jgi:hypothetical protein
MCSGGTTPTTIFFSQTLFSIQEDQAILLFKSHHISQHLFDPTIDAQLNLSGVNLCYHCVLVTRFVYATLTLMPYLHTVFYFTLIINLLLKAA